jgi:hypothetical protein
MFCIFENPINLKKGLLVVFTFGIESNQQPTQPSLTAPLSLFSTDTTMQMAQAEERIMPHLKIKPSQISPLVLVCGDPARAKLISQMLEVCF